MAEKLEQVSTMADSSFSDFSLVLISAFFLSQGGYAERSGSIHPGDELLSVDGRDVGSIQDPAGTI